MMRDAYATASIGRDYAAEQAVEQSAIDYAHSVLEEARTLAARAEDLADRLCGPVPQNASSGIDNKAVLSAILPNLREHAAVVRSRLADASEAFDRIHRNL